MILVVGATGPLGLGREIAHRLLAQGWPVRVLARSTSDPDVVNALKDLGAEVVEGDLREPWSLLPPCDGVDTVITTATSMTSTQPGDSIDATDLHGQRYLVDAARAAVASRVIYVSCSKNLRTPTPFTFAKRDVERYLQDSGVPYTILRPSCFMETWLSPAGGFDHANAKVRIYGTGEEPISWIARDDVAAFAVGCVDNPAATDRTFELGGPAALRPLDAVNIFERIAGRRFTVEHVTLDALEEQLEETEDPVRRSLVGLMIDRAFGDLVDTREAMGVVPLRLTSVEEYAERVLTSRTDPR